MNTSRVMRWIAVLAVAVSAVAVAPADAAVRATKPAKTQTWIGQVQRDRGHFDYVGQPCPTGAGMLCANYVARYRIVPRNAAAARALRRVAGGQARLQARFSATHDRTHQGTLLAVSVEGWCPPDGACGRTVTADESSNGSTVTLTGGDHLAVVLHSTYWQFGPSSDPAVVSADGQPATGPGTNCPRYPGSGCGTVTQTYTARHAGTATVTATRSTCGEAMACSPSQSQYTLTVHVS